MREISISKQWISVFLILLLLALGGWYFAQHGIPQAAQSTPTPNVNDIQASLAVKAGVEAFFAIDYRAGQEAWLAQVCATASGDGCQFAKLGAAGMWKSYQEAKTVTSASAQPEEKVTDTATEQVWRVRVELSAPLPGSAKTIDTAYALAVQTGEGWKFERFLMPEEIQALAQPATATQEGDKP